MYYYQCSKAALGYYYTEAVSCHLKNKNGVGVVHVDQSPRARSLLELNAAKGGKLSDVSPSRLYLLAYYLRFLIIYSVHLYMC